VVPVSILVVTGTDTGVGKTVVTAAVTTLALERQVPVAVVKPAQTGVAAGEPGDLDEVIRLSGVTTTFEFARFPDPLSPAAAARASGLTPVSLTDVAERASELAETHRLVVARAGLGTLNHTALTLEALAGRGLDLAGVVIGSWPREPGVADRNNVTDLETLAARPLAGALPEGAGALDRTAFARVARRGLGSPLGGGFDPSRFRATLSL
jgi:dethiobiotin synthetase